MICRRIVAPMPKGVRFLNLCNGAIEPKRKMDSHPVGRCPTDFIETGRGQRTIAVSHSLQTSTYGQILFF